MECTAPDVRASVTRIWWDDHGTLRVRLAGSGLLAVSEVVLTGSGGSHRSTAVRIPRNGGTAEARFPD